jgi:hypothetical protein
MDMGDVNLARQDLKPTSQLKGWINNARGGYQNTVLIKGITSLHPSNDFKYAEAVTRRKIQIGIIGTLFCNTLGKMLHTIQIKQYRTLLFNLIADSMMVFL